MANQRDFKGENIGIAWCDATVNLWWGCAKVHTGCKNCYAEHLSDVRYKNNFWGEQAGRKRVKSCFKDLNKYQKEAQKSGRIIKVFVGSMMDIFEDSKMLLESWTNENGEVVNTTGDLRNILFNRISNGFYNNLVFLFLTKRPQNIKSSIPQDWLINPPTNVWFGTSVSNMGTWAYAEILKSIPSSNLFLSIEPQVDEIKDVSLDGINWVIQGGESGQNKRPFDISWGYTLRDVCKEQNVPFFFKQIDKIQDIPEDLLIREFPKLK
jgi:protein gp37